MAESAEALRIEIFRQRLELYKIGAAVDVHPARLGRMLNGDIPLPPDVAKRVAAVLRGEPDPIER